MQGAREALEALVGGRALERRQERGGQRAGLVLGALAACAAAAVRTSGRRAAGTTAWELASARDADRAARRHPQGPRRRRHGCRPRRRDRPRPRARCARRQGGRGDARSRPPARRRRPGGDRHGPLARVARARPPRHRARPRRRGARPLPRHEDLDRPADRGRLLLRLRLPRRRDRLRARPARARGQDARARQGEGALHPRGRDRRAGARALRRRGAAVQGRADRRPRRGRRRVRLALHQRAVHRPVPRPARPRHGPDQGVQAALARRRVLARRREPPDAHPHLRHRVPLRQGSRRAPGAARAGARPRPSQARAGAQPLPVLRALARQPLLAAGRHGDLERPRAAVALREPRPRLPRGAHAHPLRRRALEAVGALGQVPRQHVLHRGRGTAHGPQAHELPGAHPDLQGRAPLLPRPADPLLRDGPGAPPRAQRNAARPDARPAHHAGRRPHLLHRGADPGGGHRLPGLRLLPVPHVRLRAAARALHAARPADRLRRDVGPRGGRARGRAARTASSTSSSTPATARSTGRRSTCT